MLQHDCKFPLHEQDSQIPHSGNLRIKYSARVIIKHLVQADCAELGFNYLA